MPGENGRPSFTDDQYKAWLEDMRPHLVKACSLWRAMEKCGLLQHNFSIYEKYRLGDWFSQKVDLYRASFGDTINEVLSGEVLKISDKAKQGSDKLTKDDIDVLKFMASNHRTAQPFFSQRVENAQAKDEERGKVLDTIGVISYEDVKKGNEPVEPNTPPTNTT